MILPTEKQCLDYFETYKVPRNIYIHCLKVRSTAIFLAQKLNNSNIKINIELVNCLALLHDLFKAVSLNLLQPNKFHNYVHSKEEIEMWAKLKEKYLGMYEGEIAYEVFKKDYPQLAIGLKNVGNPNKKDKSWEEMLVHYADWRTFRNKVVSLQERLEYLQEVYPRGKKIWEEDKKLIFEFEKKLCSIINIVPEKLAEEIEKSKEAKNDR